MNIKLFFLSLLFAPSFFACESKAQPKTTISPDAFEKGIAGKEVQILDVRTQTEYNNGHLKNAFLADWTQPEIFEERIKSLEKDKPVYTYCLSGARSSAAAARLKEAGFTKVYNMEGGMSAWKAAQKTVEGTVIAKVMTMENIFPKFQPAKQCWLISVRCGARPVKKWRP
jgi:rhodanese-related sulfurtransferase